MARFTQTRVEGGWVRGFPVEGPITSVFGATDIAEHAQGHSGVDIGAPSGTPIYAPSAAMVKDVFVIGVGRDDWEQTFGNSVILDDGEHVQLFAHMVGAPPVVEGQHVEAGELIGFVGSTGLSTGPHLHWGCAPSENGYLQRAYGLVDPLSLIAEPEQTPGVGEPTPAAAGGEEEQRMTGTVRPVVMHFGANSRQVERMIAGYRAAIGSAQGWFSGRLGRTFSAADPVAIDALQYGRRLEDFVVDAWGEALTTAGRAGLPVWAEGNLVAILVDKIPYTQPRLGGASPTPQAGAVVKDGDALELFARHVSGEPHDQRAYEQNVAMLVHELLHGMHANDHEDTDGPNIEHEWWEGLSADIAPVNREKLLRSIWLTPAAEGGEQPAPSAPAVDWDELRRHLDEAEAHIAAATAIAAGA